MAHELQRYYEDIEAARVDVLRASAEYRKSGNVDKINRANRKLADANQALYDCRAGLIPVR